MHHYRAGGQVNHFEALSSSTTPFPSYSCVHSKFGWGGEEEEREKEVGVGFTAVVVVVLVVLAGEAWEVHHWHRCQPRATKTC